MNTGDYEEFTLIERLKKCVTEAGNFVIIGVGDDAAALKVEEGRIILMTADSLVEGVHFDLSFVPYSDLGWRAMTANLSDVAAMGGRPIGATVCICIPPSCAAASLEELYAGMDAVASRFECRIVGGDTTSSHSDLTISISILGEVEHERLTPRSKVKPGDLLCVTGHLGGSRAGLEVLQRRKLGVPLPGSFDEAVKRYLKPIPRLKESTVMGDTVPIHAAIDISDGISSEIHHLCRMSQVGARIEGGAIPLHPDIHGVARLCNREPQSFALSGGEDFELLFAVDSRDAKTVSDAVERETGTPISVVGEAVPRDEGVSIRDKGEAWRPLEDAGFKHFL